MKIITKIKNFFKKSETTIKDKWVIPEPIGEIHYIDFKYEETLPTSMKIAAQKIGLDLVEAKHDPNIQMTSGYIHFEVDEKDIALEKTIFEMKKIKRASEKVLEKMTETEKKFNKSLEYYKHKAEHKVEQPKIVKSKTKNVK